MIDIGEDGEELVALRAVTFSGRSCGSESFLEQLSSMLGRPVHAKPRGRPRKSLSTIEADGKL